MQLTARCLSGYYTCSFCQRFSILCLRISSSSFVSVGWAVCAWLVLETQWRVSNNTHMARPSDTLATAVFTRQRLGTMKPFQCSHTYKLSIQYWLRTYSCIRILSQLLCTKSCICQKFEYEWIILQGACRVCG